MKNISELYKTAKLEITRKDRRIESLQRELDNLVFRRRGSRMKRMRDEDGEESKAKRNKEDVECDYGDDRTQEWRYRSENRNSTDGYCEKERGWNHSKEDSRHRQSNHRIHYEDRHKRSEPRWNDKRYRDSSRERNSSRYEDIRKYRRSRDEIEVDYKAMENEYSQDSYRVDNKSETPNQAYTDMFKLRDRAKFKLDRRKTPQSHRNSNCSSPMDTDTKENVHHNRTSHESELIVTNFEEDEDLWRKTWELESIVKEATKNISKQSERIIDEEMPTRSKLNRRKSHNSDYRSSTNRNENIKYSNEKPESNVPELVVMNFEEREKQKCDEVLLMKSLEVETVRKVSRPKEAVVDSSKRLKRDIDDKMSTEVKIDLRKIQKSFSRSRFNSRTEENPEENLGHNQARLESDASRLIDKREEKTDGVLCTETLDFSEDISKQSKQTRGDKKSTRVTLNRRKIPESSSKSNCSNTDNNTKENIGHSQANLESDASELVAKKLGEIEKQKSDGVSSKKSLDLDCLTQDAIDISKQSKQSLDDKKSTRVKLSRLKIPESFNKSNFSHTDNSTKGNLSHNQANLESDASELVARRLGKIQKQKSYEVSSTDSLDLESLTEDASQREAAIEIFKQSERIVDDKMSSVDLDRRKAPQSLKKSDHKRIKENVTHKLKSETSESIANHLKEKAARKNEILCTKLIDLESLTEVDSQPIAGIDNPKQSKRTSSDKTSTKRTLDRPKTPKSSTKSDSGSQTSVTHELEKPNLVLKYSKEQDEQMNTEVLCANSFELETLAGKQKVAVEISKSPKRPVNDRKLEFNQRKTQKSDYSRRAETTSKVKVNHSDAKPELVAKNFERKDDEKSGEVLCTNSLESVNHTAVGTPQEASKQSKVDSKLSTRSNLDRRKISKPLNKSGCNACINTSTKENVEYNHAKVQSPTPELAVVSLEERDDSVLSTQSIHVERLSEVVNQQEAVVNISKQPERTVNDKVSNTSVTICNPSNNSTSDENLVPQVNGVERTLTTPSSNSKFGANSTKRITPVSKRRRCVVSFKN